MSGIFTPSDSINYNFVAGVYGFFSVLCVALIVLQFFTTAVEGFFITLLPFLPLFVWSLVVRARWVKERDAKKLKEGDEKEETSEEAKKDK